LSSVADEISLCFQTVSFSLPKVELAFEILQLTSASMAASFDSVLPRYVNLGTAVSFLSFTVI
jgi:hypothetical protein